jgi:hypothetical protein
VKADDAIRHARCHNEGLLMSRLRILLLAPDCAPDGLTNPSIGYYQGSARFHAIEPVRVPLLDSLYDWALRRIFKFD